LLFIHGSGPGVTAWANWRLAIPVFAQNYHVLAPDVLGFGYSDRPAGITYGKDVWVKHLIAFLDAKGVRKCHIVGNSMAGGSPSACRCAPGLVDRMVLMGSSGCRSDHAGTRSRCGATSRPRSDADADRRLLRLRRVDRDRGSRRVALCASMQPASKSRIAACSAAAAERDQRSRDAGRRHQRITAQTLLVHGREDKVLPLSTSYELFSLLPNAQLHVFGHCGHWTQIERMAEFNAIVAAFFSGPNRT